MLQLLGSLVQCSHFTDWKEGVRDRHQTRMPLLGISDTIFLQDACNGDWRQAGRQAVEGISWDQQILQPVATEKAWLNLWGGGHSSES